MLEHNKSPTISDCAMPASSKVNNFICVISGLNHNTTYFLRAYATNDIGTGYGETISFSTLQMMVPVVVTNEASAIAYKNAISGGGISSKGAPTILSKGVCWSTDQNPTVSDNVLISEVASDGFTSMIDGLSDNTTYNLRAFATNAIGTGYGSTMSFTTKKYEGTVTDIDGNVYNIIKIGTQEWMEENLKVTHYRNGDAIPYASYLDLADSLISSGAFCNYDNDENNDSIYGRLYNWFAVNDTRYIAPAGWHVPTEEEWVILDNYLGGGSTATKKILPFGNSYWEEENDATNESGFSTLPAGLYRWQCFWAYCQWQYYGLGRTANFWSSDDQGNAAPIFFLSVPPNLSANNFDSSIKSRCLSVRCIKD